MPWNVAPHMRRPTPLLTLAVLALTSCHTPVGQCDLLPIPFDVAPSDTSLTVGDTLRMRVTLHGGPCWGHALDNGVRWVAHDTSVATVDSVTGLVTARASGTDTLGAHLPGNPIEYRQAIVTVHP